MRRRRLPGRLLAKEITTLGRGGSDTTAVALAAAFKADSCEIYTDVTGVFSADPRIVPSARKLPRLSFEEMLEMAATGGRPALSGGPGAIEGVQIPCDIEHVGDSLKIKQLSIICDVGKLSLSGEARDTRFRGQGFGRLARS